MLNEIIDIMRSEIDMNLRAVQNLLKIARLDVSHDSAFIGNQISHSLRFVEKNGMTALPATPYLSHATEREVSSIRSRPQVTILRSGN